MGAHTTPEERYEIVTRYHRSGLTRREFCEAEGISVGALRSWLHNGNWKPVDGPRFVGVTDSKRHEEDEAIEVRLGGFTSGRYAGASRGRGTRRGVVC